ncbi:MAG: hypothetical protein GWM88_08350 [Pseudomonadales bacterium]|nr:zinc ribbon domain-containing protein [Pseudomonadales bacterium]NIX08014.1 hypothetical protein [Pseudomonadales bacterium]
MPIYVYRCRFCGGVTERFDSVNDAPESVTCAHCDSAETHRVISTVAYHASEATKTSKLDPKYDKMVDHAMDKSTSADVDRLVGKMKPFPKGAK